MASDVERIKLPERATRGRRMQALVDDEDTGDEEFWGQDFFQEEEKDVEYGTESEAEDVVDSDFELSVRGLLL